MFSHSRGKVSTESLVFQSWCLAAFYGDLKHSGIDPDLQIQEFEAHVYTVYTQHPSKILSTFTMNRRFKSQWLGENRMPMDAHQSGWSSRSLMGQGLKPRPRHLKCWRASLRSPGHRDPERCRVPGQGNKANVECENWNVSNSCYSEYVMKDIQKIYCVMSRQAL